MLDEQINLLIEAWVIPNQGRQLYGVRDKEWTAGVGNKRCYVTPFTVECSYTPAGLEPSPLVVFVVPVDFRFKLENPEPMPEGLMKFPSLRITWKWGPTFTCTPRYTLQDDVWHVVHYAGSMSLQPDQAMELAIRLDGMRLGKEIKHLHPTFTLSLV